MGEFGGNGADITLKTPVSWHLPDADAYDAHDRWRFCGSPINVPRFADGQFLDKPMANGMLRGPYSRTMGRRYSMSSSSPLGVKSGLRRLFAAEESFVGNRRGIASRFEICDAHGVGNLDHRIHWEDIVL